MNRVALPWAPGKFAQEARDLSDLLLLDVEAGLCEKASRIEEAITNYIANLPGNDQHPFLMRRSNSFRFTGAWSCLMRGQGHHKNHLHPDGWISSAYYVTVPEAVNDPKARNGWLKFGEPSLDLPLNNAIRRAVQPVPGRLVLFPSYMWHGTVPLEAQSARTTIAFDAVPR